MCAALLWLSWWWEFAFDALAQWPITPKSEETRLSVINPFHCEISLPSGYVRWEQGWFTAQQLFSLDAEVDRTVTYSLFGDLVAAKTGLITHGWGNGFTVSTLTGTFTPHDGPKQLILGFSDDQPQGMECRQTWYFTFLDRTGPSKPDPITANYYMRASREVEELHFWWDSSVDTGVWFSEYTFALSPNSNLSNPIVVHTTTDQSYVFAVGDFPEYGYWYWQVWAHDTLWNTTPWAVGVILYINDYGWGWWGWGGGHGAPDDKPDDWVDWEEQPAHESAPDMPWKPPVKPPKTGVGSPLPPVLDSPPSPILSIYPTCADLIKRGLTCTPGLPPPQWWFPPRPVSQVTIPSLPRETVRDRDIGRDIAMVGDDRYDRDDDRFVADDDRDDDDRLIVGPIFPPEIMDEIRDLPPNVVVPRLLTRQSAPSWVEPIILTTNAFLFVWIWYDLETLRRWYRLWNNHHQSVYTQIVWHNGMWFIIHDTTATLYSTLTRHDA
jgi:hypothetical protein